MLARRAAHVVALGIDARRLRIAVLQQQIDVGDRRLVVELAVDAEQRRRRLVEQAHGLERQRRDGRQKFLDRLHAHRAAAGVEQARRAEQIGRAAGGEGRHQPFALEAVVHVAAVEHRALDAVGGGEGEPRRPVGAEAAAPDRDALAVDVVARRQMIEPGEIGAFGGRIAVQHRVLAAARPVDGERGEAGLHDVPWRSAGGPPSSRRRRPSACTTGGLVTPGGFCR